MITDTLAEDWFALIAFFVCNYGILGHEFITKKWKNNKKILQYVCVFFMVIGVYTTLNGIYHLDWIAELWNAFTDKSELVGEAAKKRKGVLGLIFLLLWPFLAIIFGILTTLYFRTTYKNT